jgi:L-2,4-diaminobutyrate decarboxylase
VLFRPSGADDAAVAAVRRSLLAEGRAVLGRAGMGRGGGLWLKATLLNPHARHSDLEALLKLVHDALPSPAPLEAAPLGAAPFGGRRERRV